MKKAGKVFTVMLLLTLLAGCNPSLTVKQAAMKLGESEEKFSARLAKAKHFAQVDDIVPSVDQQVDLNTAKKPPKCGVCEKEKNAMVVMYHGVFLTKG
ncbi:MAG: hypothetical protein IJQ21_11680 [Lachnospiraceae bacterium]|nr:hypothetical protein [Lachnospiraceae bacterium]